MSTATAPYCFQFLNMSDPLSGCDDDDAVNDAHVVDDDASLGIARVVPDPRGVLMSDDEGHDDDGCCKGADDGRCVVR